MERSLNDITKDHQKHMNFMNTVFEFTRKELRGKDFLEDLSTSLKLICNNNHRVFFTEKRWDGTHIFVDKKCRKTIYVKWIFNDEIKKDTPHFRCCGREMRTHPTTNGVRHYYCNSCNYKIKLYDK
jgi:hypothetical protein